MEELLQGLIDLLGEEMPELSTIDEDYGQLEMINREDRSTYPLTYPAVLINASDVVWSNLAGLSQKGQATIRVRLIIDCYDDTHYGSNTTELIANRAALRAKLHKLLQGFRIEKTDQMIRQSSRFYTWDHGIKVYEAVYTCTVTEMLLPETTTIKPAPKPSITVRTGPWTPQ